jgi:cytochrome P450
LNEVLRLYPAVPGNRKQALADDILPDGTPVRKGDEITFQPFCQGRSKLVWGPDAKEFKPERWISDDGNSLIRVDHGKFPAFHAGPRTCLGKYLIVIFFY